MNTQKGLSRLLSSQVVTAIGIILSFIPAIDFIGAILVLVGFFMARSAFKVIGEEHSAFKTGRALFNWAIFATVLVVIVDVVLVVLMALEALFAGVEDGAAMAASIASMVGVVSVVSIILNVASTLLGAFAIFSGFRYMAKLCDKKGVKLVLDLVWVLRLVSALLSLLPLVVDSLGKLGSIIEIVSAILAVISIILVRKQGTLGGETPKTVKAEPSPLPASKRSAPVRPEHREDPASTPSSHNGNNNIKKF